LEQGDGGQRTRGNVGRRALPPSPCLGARARIRTASAPIAMSLPEGSDLVRLGGVRDLASSFGSNLGIRLGGVRDLASSFFLKSSRIHILYGYVKGRIVDTGMYCCSMRNKN
ncbi:hypothetical protein Taro_036509, partial [Colocasia esculenta]|nr:hypothetical protein [Colocasia esculenta]